MTLHVYPQLQIKTTCWTTMVKQSYGRGIRNYVWATCTCQTVKGHLLSSATAIQYNAYGKETTSFVYETRIATPNVSETTNGLWQLCRVFRGQWFLYGAICQTGQSGSVTWFTACHRSLRALDAAHKINHKIVYTRLFTDRRHIPTILGTVAQFVLRRNQKSKFIENKIC